MKDVGGIPGGREARGFDSTESKKEVVGVGGGSEKEGRRGYVELGFKGEGVVRSRLHPRLIR